MKDINPLLVKMMSSAKGKGKEFSDFETCYALLKNILTQGASQGVSQGFNALSLSPLAMALSPWVAGARVAMSVGKTMQLHDLMSTTLGNKTADYRCTCGRCEDAIKFVIDKREASAIKLGLSAGVLPAPFVGLYTAGRNAFKIVTGTKGQVREAHAKQLIQSALPTSNFAGVGRDGGIFEVKEPGCPRAQAAIAALYEELAPEREPGGYTKTLAAIVAVNGYLDLKKQMNG